MKKLIFIFYFFLLYTVTQAQVNDCYTQLFQKGMELYNQKNYPLAIKKWQAALGCSNITKSQRDNINTWIATATHPPKVKPPAENLIVNSKSLIVGAWSGIVEGDKVIWNVFSDGTDDFKWYHTNSLQHSAAKWQVDGDIMYAYKDGINTWSAKLKFITKNHLILTVISNGNPDNQGQERHYYRIQK